MIQVFSYLHLEKLIVTSRNWLHKEASSILTTPTNITILLQHILNIWSLLHYFTYIIFTRYKLLEDSHNLHE